jgi:hypothetical protein
MPDADIQVSPRFNLTESEIVADIIANLSPSDWVDLAAIPREQLILLHSTTGRDIRNIYALWRFARGEDHPDDISQRIIEAVYAHVTALPSPPQPEA